MKFKALPLIIFMILCLIGNGQNNQAFKYQAIARDAAGHPLTETEVNIRIKLINEYDESEYTETHFVITNNFGLLNLEIGNGELVEGSFNDIDWGSGDYFIEISIDPQGGSNYILMGSSQLLSVPMASYAAVAGNVIDTSNYNELQKIKLIDNELVLLPDGGEVDLSPFDNMDEILDLSEKVRNDSIYYEANFFEIDQNLLLIEENIGNEISRAQAAESLLSELINQNAVNIISDSSYFQDLFDNISFETDSLYFKSLIDGNTNRIINDSTFLKSLIDANTYSIQQEITRAILSESINNANIMMNTEAIANLQSQEGLDSLFFKQLIDANTNSIMAEITRAISAELLNSNNISTNTQTILINKMNILEDSISFQNQINDFDFHLQEEITRAIYKDQVNSDSIQYLYYKMISDSTFLQNQINSLSAGGLDQNLGNGKIFIGDNNNMATEVSLSGDAQLSNTGILIISPSSITTNKIANGNVTNTKLDNSGIIINDDHGNTGEISLGDQLQINGTGATNLYYNPNSKTLDITSTDNQFLSLNGNSISISSGNTLDLTSIVGQAGATGPQGEPGPAGTDGNDGIGIQSAINNGDGTFTITYTNGNTFTSDDLTGPQGNQGIQGPAGPQGVNGPAGTNGDDGIGIQSAINNGNGTFTITYTNGNTFTSDDLTGPQGNQGIQGPAGPQGVNGPAGNDGIGIQSAVNNGNGTFTITYTNGNTFISEDLTGPQGIQGIQGPIGPQGGVGQTGATGATGATGEAGTNGFNINWLGSVYPRPSNPNTNDGYHDPVLKKAFVYDGTLWVIVSEDGPQGPQGPTGPQGPAGTSLRDCPTTGSWTALNDQFCIEGNENTAKSWWEASKYCGDQNSHLCTWDEWYYACQNSNVFLSNMTNDWEWTNAGQPGATPKATVVGDGSCTDSSTEEMSDTNSFRCCFTR